MVTWKSVWTLCLQFYSPIVIVVFDLLLLLLLVEVAFIVVLLLRLFIIVNMVVVVFLIMMIVVSIAITSSALVVRRVVVIRRVGFGVVNKFAGRTASNSMTAILVSTKLARPWDLLGLRPGTEWGSS